MASNHAIGAFSSKQTGHAHEVITQPLRSSGDRPSTADSAQGQIVHYLSSDPSQSHPSMRHGVSQRPINSHQHIQHHQYPTPTSEPSSESPSTSTHSHPPPMLARVSHNYEPSHPNDIASLPSPSPSATSQHLMPHRRESLDRTAPTREQLTQSPLAYSAPPTHTSHYSIHGGHAEPTFVQPHSTTTRRPSGLQIHSNTHTQPLPNQSFSGHPTQPQHNEGQRHQQQIENQAHGPPFDRALQSRPSVGYVPSAAGTSQAQMQPSQVRRTSLNDSPSQPIYGPRSTSNALFPQQPPPAQAQHVVHYTHPPQGQLLQLSSYHDEQDKKPTIHSRPSPQGENRPPYAPQSQPLSSRPPPPSAPSDPIVQVNNLLQQHSAPLIMEAWNNIHTDMRALVANLVASHKNAISAHMARSQVLQAQVNSFASEIQAQRTRIHELENQRRVVKTRLRETQEALSSAQQERDIGREELGRHWQDKQDLQRQLAIERARPGSVGTGEGASEEGGADEVHRLRRQVRELVMAMKLQTKLKPAVPAGETAREMILAQTMKSAMASSEFQRGIAALLATAHENNMQSQGEVQAAILEASSECDSNSALISSISPEQYEAPHPSTARWDSRRGTSSADVSGHHVQHSELQLPRREGDNHCIPQGRLEKRSLADMEGSLDEESSERASKRNRRIMVEPEDKLPAEISVRIKPEPVEVEMDLGSRGADDTLVMTDITGEAAPPEPPTSRAKIEVEEPTIGASQGSPELSRIQPFHNIQVEKEPREQMRVDRGEREAVIPQLMRQPSPVRAPQRSTLDVSAPSSVDSGDEEEDGELSPEHVEQVALLHQRVEEGEITLASPVSMKGAMNELDATAHQGSVSTGSPPANKDVAICHSTVPNDGPHVTATSERACSASTSSIHFPASLLSDPVKPPTSAPSWLALPSSSRAPIVTLPGDPLPIKRTSTPVLSTLAPPIANLPPKPSNNQSFRPVPTGPRLSSSPGRASSSPKIIPYYPPHVPHVAPQTSKAASTSRYQFQADASSSRRPRPVSLFKPASVPTPSVYSVEERLIPFVFHTTPKKYVCTFCASRYKNADPQTCWPPIPTFPIPGTSTSNLLAHCQKSHSSPCEHLAKMTDDELRQRKEKIVSGLERKPVH